MRLPENSDIGMKVSIRLFEPEGGFRDLLGILESATTVRKKSGELVEFDPVRIALWKIVPTSTY
jgi:hypothetical protein